MTLSWELSGWIDRRARRDAQISKGDQLDLAVRDAKRQIERSLATTRAAIEQSARVRERQKKELAAAEELHRIVTDEYGAGEATALEVDAAFADWQQAQQNLERETLRDQRLRYRLRLLTGEDLWPDTP